MTSSSDERNPVEALAEEFLDRKRRGEQPTLREYLNRYPDLADEIRELFPALLMMEDLGEDSGGTTGSLAGDGVAAVGARLQKLGDYRILREVGRGGMGVVYEAEQESLGRRVALKVLSANALVDPNQIRRFEREARAAAKLHHTNIVPVFGVGQQDGHHYYVMQFIAGLGLDVVLEDLRRLRGSKAGQAHPAAPDVDVLDPHDLAAPCQFRLTAAEVARSLITGEFARDGSAPIGAGSTEPFEGASATTQPPIGSGAGSSSVVLTGSSDLSALSDSDRRFYQSIARIGVQVAEALEYANRQGILHRDVKPSNLLLDNRGNVWVADFGLAKTAEADDLTHTGDILGTIRYMAPERFESNCDARSDVYSLGLTLYELVALRPAYQAADRNALMERVLHEEPARLKKLAPSVPRDLETIIVKAIGRDPATRYATAAALAEDLQRFVEDRPIRARRVSPAERLLRWGRRNKLVAGLLAGLITSLVAGLLVSTTQWVRADRHAAREVALRADMARDLYTSDMIAVQQAWEAGNVKGMGNLLHRHEPKPGETDWRGFEWHVFQRHLERAQPLRTLPVSDVIVDLAATPNGETVAALVNVHAADPADDRVEVTLWDGAIDWKPRTFSRPPRTFESAIALSPDGSVFAAGSEMEVQGGKRHVVTIWDATTGKPRPHRPKEHEAMVSLRSLAFSPDGKKLLWSDADSTVNLWDLETDEVRTFKGHKGTCRGVAFDPRGRWIASGSGDGTAKLWDLESRHEVQSLPTPFVQGLAVSPDGRYLAAATDSGARLWDLSSPRKPRETELQGNTKELIESISISPNGLYLAATISNGVKLWEVESGEARAVLKGHSNLLFKIAFLDGGRMLASGSMDRTIKVWDVAHALDERDVLTVPSSSVRSMVFTPDGGTLFSGGLNALIRSWDVATGRQLAEFAIPQAVGDIYGLAISRDGRTLAVAGVGLWDLETHRLVELPPQSAALNCLSFSPKGEILAASYRDNTIRLWNAVTREQLRTINPGRGESNTWPYFSPDGRILASGGSDQRVKLRYVARGGELAKRLVGHTAWIVSLAFAPDGRALASGSGDGTVIIWDVSDPPHSSLRLRLEGNAGAIWAVAYSPPDGDTIAASTQDGTVKLWDPATGRERCTLVGHTASVHALAFSPDGSVLATGDTGGTIRFWRR
jgi:WD40 repeat protein/serine/threonine protein kinase